MENDFSWLLLLIPLVFALGWMASRLDLRQWRIENRRAPKAYFMGLNFLLNEQQDQAIDAFIEAVQNDPDTSELHFALGNLFRRRGEYDRAVRVHEHLLSRADLSVTDRHRAQQALGLDFLKAGLLDRAEAALTQLDGTPLQAQAQLARLMIFERSRDWSKAVSMAAQLESGGEGSFVGRQAHYMCEQAHKLASQGQTQAALELYDRASQSAPAAARPRFERARLLHRLGQTQQAFDEICRTRTDHCDALPLIAVELAQWAIALGQHARAAQMLEQAYARANSLDVVDALVLLEEQQAPGTDASALYLAHLQREPSLVAAAKWLTRTAPLADAQLVVNRALDRAARPLSRYRCAACGFEVQQHFWQCPGCQAWDSFPAKRVEEL